MSNSFKFQCNEKVLFKTTNKEALVVKTNFSYTKSYGYKTKYTVAIEKEYWDPEHWASTYMGKRYFHVECNEEDLDKLTEKSQLIPMHIGYQGIQFSSDGVAWKLEPPGIVEMTEPLKPEDCLLGPVTPCEHSWKTYEGLVNRFDFCEKCDKKR